MKNNGNESPIFMPAVHMAASPSIRRRAKINSEMILLPGRGTSNIASCYKCGHIRPGGEKLRISLLIIVSLSVGGYTWRQRDKWTKGRMGQNLLTVPVRFLKVERYGRFLPRLPVTSRTADCDVSAVRIRSCLRSHRGRNITRQFMYVKINQIVILLGLNDVFTLKTQASTLIKTVVMSSTRTGDSK